MNPQDINAMLEVLRQSFIDVMKKYDLDKSDLVKKSKFIYKDNHVVILMNDYSEYVDSGRKKGKAVPVNDIIKWIRSSAVNVPNGLSVEDFAWAVSKSIERKGIKPRPFLDTLNDEVRGLVLKYVFAQVNKTLQKTFKTK